MKLRHTLFLLYAMATISLSVHAIEPEDTREVSIGYIEFPPVFSTNSEGEPEGLLIDLAKMVIPKAGYRWKARSLPAKRMAETVVKGELDLWIGLSTLPEFEDTTYIGRPVVATIELNAYWLGDRLPIHREQDLSNKRVITLHGYSYGGWIKTIQNPANQVIECRAFSQEQAVNMLKYGRCDYLLNYTGPMKNQLRYTPIEDLRHNRISALEARFVVSKKAENAQQLLRSLVKAYYELVAEGRWPLNR